MKVVAGGGGGDIITRAQYADFEFKTDWKVAPEANSGIMYRVTEFIGKWSMVDVFVVAILVALVHLGGLLVIRPGIAALSFAGVVIVTMIAAESFDPRLIWDGMEEAKSENKE